MPTAAPYVTSLSSGLQKSHIPGLDGLRLVAVMLVILYHFGYDIIPGGHGVMIFFVLSGFLITWLLLKEHEKTGTLSLRGFYRRRILRIFPAFYAFWILWTSALLIFDKPVPWAQAIAALGYVSNYYTAIVGDPNTGYSHTWSLAIEEQFYLLWPLALLAIGDRVSSRIRALALFIAGVWVYRCLLVVTHSADQGYIYAAFDTRADHLAVGCLLAVVLRHGYLNRFWHFACRPWASCMTMAIFAASVALGQWIGTSWRDTVGFAVDPILIAILIAQTIALRETRLWRWLNWRWVTFGGTLSYSMYLYQQVLIHPIRHLLQTNPEFVQLIAVLAAIVLVAMSSYYLVEKPFLGLKQTTGSKAQAITGLLARSPSR